MDNWGKLLSSQALSPMTEILNSDKLGLSCRSCLCRIPPSTPGGSPITNGPLHSAILRDFSVIIYVLNRPNDFPSQVSGSF